MGQEAFPDQEPDEEPVAAGPWIRIVSSDGKEFALPKRAAFVADFFKHFPGMDEEDGDDGGGDERGGEALDPIEVSRVNGRVLERVVEFLVHYQTDPLREIELPLQGDSLETIVNNHWYVNFVQGEEMANRMIFEIIAAANYMGIQPLLDLACLWCTFEIVGKSHEEIRVLLNIPEMTPEEEAEARQNHPWIFEEIN